MSADISYIYACHKHGFYAVYQFNDTGHFLGLLADLPVQSYSPFDQID